jgi:glycosyltransferase involved in cell wall biosynthesis
MRVNSPIISVIIPTLQEEKYIKTILSRLKKTKKLPLEVLVVDGGSRDKTVEIAQRFTKKVFSIKKRGISAGKNYGAKHAKGDILIFLDTDIIFPLDFAEKTRKALRDAKVVGATCNIMPDPRQSRMGATIFFSFYNALIRASTKIKPHARGEFFVVRRKAFLKAKGFDENMPCLEDHEFANRLSKFGRFVFIRELTVYESLRRFQKLGFWHVVGTWFMDYVSFMFFRRTVSNVWRPVR